MREFLKAIVFWCIIGVSIAALSSCGSTSSDEEVVDPDAPTYTITVELYDTTTGELTNSVSEGSPGFLRIFVNLYTTGEAVVGAYVVLTTDKGAFQNSDGTGLTDANGIADFTLVVDSQEVGAGQISFQVNGESLEYLFTFTIGDPEEPEEPDVIKLGSFENGVFMDGVLGSSLAAGEELSVGASTTITANLVKLNDSGVYEPYVSNDVISFSTRCADAELGESKYMGDGETTITYSAGPCTGRVDTVTATATISETELSAFVDVATASPDIGTIEFVSTDPETIALSGSVNSELPKSSTVTFLVKDELENPMKDALVSFSISTTKGGLSLAPATDLTDADGYAQTIVTSGSVVTSAYVKASVTLDDGTTITADSSELIVSTGLSDQNSFTLSAEYYNPEAWNYNNEPVEITIQAADHFNNPVLDGTIVYFTTEGGAIEASCITTGGICSVTWTSQNVRPSDGRVTILATAIGEESFTDNNGNGLFETDPSLTNTPDTLLTDMPEAWLDIDEDGIFDPGLEEFSDFNGDNLYTQANGVYNGSLCNDTVCTTELIDVRESIVLIMSSSFADIEFDPDDEVTFSDINDFELVTVTISDANGNSMPYETDITITAPANSTIGGESTFTDTLASRTGPSVYSFYIQPEDTYEGGEVDFLEVEVVTPKNNRTIAYLQVNYPAYAVDTNLNAGFTFVIDGLTVVFQDTSTSDVGITSWDWDFGDGRTSSSQNPQRSYTNGGSYVVSLTVEDESGATDTFSQTITVSEDTPEG